MKDSKQNWRTQMVWGAAIVAVGVAFLLDRTGQIDIGSFWRYWPLVMVIAGLSNLVPPTSTRLVLGGLQTIALGAWLFISFQHLWGLGFHNSWPILIIMWGVQMALKPVLVNYLDQRLGHQQ